MSLNRYLKLMYDDLMNSNHSDIMLEDSESYKISPSQCFRQENKKIIFANISGIADICKRLKRSDAPATSYIFAKLDTSRDVDSS